MPFRRLPMEKRRAEILAAAIDVFGHRLAHEVSIDDVAAAAGTSRASVYRCFDGKQDLYLASMHELGLRLAESLAREGTGPPEARLELGLRHYFEFFEEYGTLLLFGFPGNPEASREVIQQFRERVYAWVYRTYGISSPSPLLETAVQSWVAGVEWAAADWSRRHRSDRAEVEALLSRQLSLSLKSAVTLSAR